MNERNEKMKLRGRVKEILPGGVIMVCLENNAVVTCRVSGKMRQNSISILLNDDVEVELSLYDLTKGRIVYRYFN